VAQPSRTRAPGAPEPKAVETGDAESVAGPPGGAEAEPQDEAGEAGPGAIERERDEYLDLAKRTQAEFENYRKRVAKDMAAAGERAKAALIRELLPVVDNLERALGAGGDGESLAEGVKLVYAELVAALERNGVTAFEPEGEPFDPSLHEALSTREDPDAGPGVVLEVVEKGYRVDAAVLRPARVVVSA
jgi:molecular chaperone GrpE